MELLKIKPKKNVVKRKKKARNVKYSMTLSDAENKLLTRVCQKDETTPVRLIKSVLHEYLRERVANFSSEVGENQLSLFKNLTPIQYRIED